MIFVRDLPRMADFYASLGLQPIEETRMENWIEFDTGGAKFSLHQIPAHILTETGTPPAPAKPREGTPVKLTFEVPDAEAERLRLQGLGVQFVQRPWGDWDAIDPEGNVFHIRSAAR